MTKQQSKNKGMTKTEAQEYQKFAHRPIIALVVCGGFLGFNTFLHFAYYGTQGFIMEIFKCVAFFLVVVSTLIFW
jgi:hypothetical protein